MCLWAFSIVSNPYKGLTKWSLERVPVLLTGPLGSPIAPAFTWASSSAQVRESQGRCHYHLCTNGETEARKGAQTCYVRLVVSDSQKQTVISRLSVLSTSRYPLWASSPGDCVWHHLHSSPQGAAFPRPLHSFLNPDSMPASSRKLSLPCSSLSQSFFHMHIHSKFNHMKCSFSSVLFILPNIISIFVAH